MDKRTILKFVGGDRDGEVLDTQDDVGPSPQAAGLVWMLGGAQIGKAFWGASEAGKQFLKEHGPEEGNPGFKPHVYKVTAREETADQIDITLTFSGHDPKNP